MERRLGEKSQSGGMWDVCKRGLEGELYDEEGGIVFSQELRMETRETRESSPDVPLTEVEAVELDSTPKSVRQEASVVILEEQPIIEDIAEVEVVATTQAKSPPRRKEPKGKVADNGMPLYSTYTLTQLQVSPSSK